MKHLNYCVIGTAAAGCLMIALPTFAQTAPAGTCQIFEHNDFGGAAGTVVGNQESGDAVLFVSEDQAPGDLVAFLGGTVKYRLFYDASWKDMISSVKVSAGCTAELHNSLAMQQGSTLPFASYTADTASIGDEQNDKAQMVICRCPQ